MLYYFNPGHETAVLNASPYYKPPAIQMKMQEDLSFLPAWYASEKNFVWVEKELPVDFLAFLTENFDRMPRVTGKYNLNEYLPELYHTQVKLWGISPQSIYYFQQLNKNAGLSLQLPEWKNEYRELSGRLSAKDCLEFLSESSKYISKDIIPSYYTSLEEIEKKINVFSGNYVIKSPYSSSGRGLLWIEKNINQSNRQVLQGMLNKQLMVSIEKALDKKVDFSMQFSSDGKGQIVFEGLSLFLTDGRGNYRGTCVCSQQKIQSELSKYLQPELLEQVKSLLIKYLTKKYACIYTGELGVDMMVYEESGRYKFHPCVEINMRTTMGFLALQLQKKMADENIRAFFRIDYFNQPGEVFRQHLKLTKDLPLKTSGGKAFSGYFPLCPVTNESLYWAYVIIDAF